MELDLHHNLAHSPPSPLLIPLCCCVASCFAYRAHTARLLQPRTSASAYGVAVVLDIASPTQVQLKYHSSDHLIRTVVEHYPSPTQTPSKYYPNSILHSAQSSILSFETNPALPLHISFIKYTQSNLIHIQVSLHPAQILKINSILEGRQFFQFPLFRHPSIASP